MIVIFAR